jgi:hypothetical protein
MAAADTDTTAELPSVGRRRRRRWPWALLAGAMSMAALGYVLADRGGGARLSSDASGTPAPTVTSIVPDEGGSTVTPQPVPTTALPTTTALPERLSAGSRLSLDGLGPVDIGMTLEQASAAAGTPIRIRPDDPYDGDCHYAYAAGVPEVAFMVINGRIARVDVGDRSGRRVTTVSGIGVGDAEEAVKRTYPGRIRVEGHPYRPTGHYLVYVPADPALAHLSMIFETDEQVVTTFRAGMKGAVAQIEGCS